jgi:hypothetical protein
MAQPLSNNLSQTRHIPFPTTANTCSVRHPQTSDCVSHDAAQIAGGAACLEYQGLACRPVAIRNAMRDKPRKPQLHEVNGPSPQ